jgi:hypothetical protein
VARCRICTPTQPVDQCGCVCAELGLDDPGQMTARVGVARVEQLLEFGEVGWGLVHATSFGGEPPTASTMAERFLSCVPRSTESDHSQSVHVPQGQRGSVVRTSRGRHFASAERVEFRLPTDLLTST